MSRHASPREGAPPRRVVLGTVAGVLAALLALSVVTGLVQLPFGPGG